MTKLLCFVNISLVLEKLNIYQNKKLHQSVSHVSATIIAFAAATGAAGALDPQQLALATIYTEPMATNHAREVEAGHSPISLGGLVRTAHSSGKR